MTRCNCGAEVLEDSICPMCSSDCINVTGKGDSGRELKLTPITDPDPDNLYSHSVSGQLAKLPPLVLAPPSCQAYNNANISIPDNDSTVVSLNAERYDSTGTMHDNATLNSRITFPSDGIYICTFTGSFAANIAGDRSAWIRKNGNIYLAATQKIAVNSASIETGLVVMYEGFFEAGEFIQAIAQQDSGGALNLLATRYSPVLSVRWRRKEPV